MTIAGFSFTKMMVEKKGSQAGQININTNISIASAEEIDFVMGPQKQKGIKILFEYRNTYTPDIGSVVIGGEILYLSEQKKHDELMKAWKKDKKFPNDVMAELFDRISVKGCVESIQLTSSVSIPPPIPLPRFRPAPEAAAPQKGKKA